MLLNLQKPREHSNDKTEGGDREEQAEPAAGRGSRPCVAHVRQGDALQLMMAVWYNVRHFQEHTRQQEW